MREKPGLRARGWDHALREAALAETKKKEALKFRKGRTGDLFNGICPQALQLGSGQSQFNVRIIKLKSHADEQTKRKFWTLW